MLNINFGKNQELLGKCKALYEYASYIEKVKKYKKKMSLREAVDRAVNNFILDFVNQEMANVVLSIDGRKSVHDKMRPLAGGQGSYDLVLFLMTTN